MKATKEFKQYRLAVLPGLTKKEYRDLQAGKDIKVPDGLVKKHPDLFVDDKKKEVKDG